MANAVSVLAPRATPGRTLRPVLKWAGGKTQLLSELLRNTPDQYGTYIEPFLGGGALYFALQPQRAVLSDSNPELINMYKQLVASVEAVIEILKEFKNEKQMFYRVRADHYGELDPVYAAARTIYLNHTCFNGLYRLNRAGDFNVPFGRYENPTICDAEGLRTASGQLASVRIVLGDYKEVLRSNAQSGDFVYLDPPYLPVSKYSDFKRYTTEQFYEDDHRELAAEVERLHELGCHVLLTNSNHPLVHDLYEGFDTRVIGTKRNINKQGQGRKGTDIIVSISQDPPGDTKPGLPVLTNQVTKFPPTRFMGSKERLLPAIWQAASQFEFTSVLDLFSGSGVVAYMFKAQGKRVYSNDYMAMCADHARAMVENSDTRLDERDVDILLTLSERTDQFVQRTFEDCQGRRENVPAGRSKTVPLNATL